MEAVGEAFGKIEGYGSPEPSEERNGLAAAPLEVVDLFKFAID